jgi:hypothetical protein
VNHTLLSGRLLNLGGHANTNQTVVRLKLLHGLVGVVDEGKAGRLATTKLGAETKDGNLVLVGLVELRELGAELVLGDVGAVGVEDITVQEGRKRKALVSLGVDLNIEEILVFEVQ